jgi:hypothetical protein
VTGSKILRILKGQGEHRQAHHRACPARHASSLVAGQPLWGCVALPLLCRCCGVGPRRGGLHRTHACLSFTRM